MGIMDQRCDGCGEHVPEGDGVIWESGRVYVCGKCSDRMMDFGRDYSKSARGRLRSPRELVKVVQGLGEIP